MLFGLDGVELGLIIVFVCLFAGIMTGFPVAFAIGGAAMISFSILTVLGEYGLLLREIIDTRSDAYRQLLANGVNPDVISRFNYPDLPVLIAPLFERGADGAVFRTLSFIVNRMNERVLAGQSIETLLAVAMFVLMGIALERSRIAEDLLTTMARLFGQLPGGLAVSVIVVGAFLAASTGIVGATVVTMGLLSLPTMLRRGYSPELSTGVIAASGTLGQIIPPSIVIILLGSLAGDLYSVGQDNRAQLAGCVDALTFLGKPAVLSVGTLFQAAFIPGIMLAVLYAVYAFCYALLQPDKAPPIHDPDRANRGEANIQRSLFWFLAIPAIAIVLVSGANMIGIAGQQTVTLSNAKHFASGSELRTNVSDKCKASMIELHGQDKWDRSLAAQEKRDADGPVSQPVELSEEQKATRLLAAIDALPPLSGALLISLLLITLIFTTAYGVAPTAPLMPLAVGGSGIAVALLIDGAIIEPTFSPGLKTLLLAVPLAMIAYGMRQAFSRLSENELLRVVFPPLILIIAVLGSILGGITNPTPAAALGAAGALMLAAYRKLSMQENATRSKRFIIQAGFAVIILILIGVNFDLRATIQHVRFESWVAIFVSLAAYHIAIAGLLFSCYLLLRDGILTPIVHETAKVTSMVFTILIGSQMLNLVVISFGGEDYIQSFLRSFEREWVVFLFVMLVLFVLGFVLDFLEIIYIVIPIVGPVIYGGTMDPMWVTIMIAINLQTSFLTPPFGFALFYLRGVAPPSITTGHIYRGVAPFVVIQVFALGLLWLFPSIVTILPNLLPN
ncbi:MAG: TRAP transporter large permease [Alphaproteobacteria bacterium]